ncbi:MAG TPA: hypothetical protein VN538_03905 [Clostridia bacterium]|nr:hypothetical protein [Clostridia bacterium]
MIDQSDINKLQDTETEAISSDISPKSQSDSSNHMVENKETNIENTTSENSEYDSKDIPGMNLPASLNTIELVREIQSIVKMTLDSITPIVAFAMQVKKVFDDYREPLRQLYEDSITFFDGIKNVVIGFRNYLDILETLKRNQITVWYNVDFCFSEDFTNSDQVSSLLLKYFTSNENDKLVKLINDCKLNCRCATTSILINQVEAALLRNDYHLAAIGLTAILDGILSEVSEDTAQRVERRLTKIERSG